MIRNETIIVIALLELDLNTQKPRISFVINDQLKSELEAQALLESRTISNLVLLAVKEYLEKSKSDRLKSKGKKP